jgi:hypothetical protein
MPDSRYTPESETARVLGRLEAKVAAIEGRMERLEANGTARMAVIEQKLDVMANTLAQSMGAAKLVHWLGGAVVAGIGFLASLAVRQGK